MNTVCAAAVTKSGNPLCDKSHVELTLRVMQPATETGRLKVPHQGNEVRHEHGARSGGDKVRQSTMRQVACGIDSAGNSAGLRNHSSNVLSFPR